MSKRQRRTSQLITHLNTTEINMALEKIYDRLDKFEGLRSNPVFLDDVDMSSNFIKNLAGLITSEGGETETAEINLPTVILEYRVSSGTHGGGQYANVWNTRPLNLEVLDTDNLCNLASNTFILDAGTYDLKSWFSFFASGISKVRLMNVTRGENQKDLYGNSISSVNQYSSGYAGCVSPLIGRFIINSKNSLRFEAIINNANLLTGWGLASSYSSELYSYVELVKTA